MLLVCLFNPQLVCCLYVFLSAVKPQVILQSVCCDFYHKPIKLTWLRDDKEVTTDVTSTEELADGDWYYQIHSHLEYFPKPGEKVSCVVEHQVAQLLRYPCTDATRCVCSLYIQGFAA
uniref:Immunoglobulin C1-set domain-containing protein n=2 Tax=Cyprinus carpio TaxID=7962 RepID=A0A8C2ISV1_CYPCA